MSVILIGVKTLLLIAFSLAVFFGLAAGLGADLTAAPQMTADCGFVEIRSCGFLIF